MATSDGPGPFGVLLQHYRVAAGLSQEELAARMGVEQGYVSRLEAGTRNPTIVTIWHAAQSLGVRPAVLFEETVYMPKSAAKPKEGRN